MSQIFFTTPTAFATKAGSKNVSIVPVATKSYKSWLAKQTKETKAFLKNKGFAGKAGQKAVYFSNAGVPSKIFVGIHDDVEFFDMAHAALAAQKLAPDFVKTATFSISGTMKKDAQVKSCISWALASYKFDQYKKDDTPVPKLVWPKGVDKTRVLAHIESACLLRNLINTPANDLTPDDIEKAMRKMAEKHKATVKVTKGAPLKSGFPLVHTVGMASETPPRLIDISWGNTKHPKVTLVGKGVSFDTGGLNLKPTQYMALMKKDMGGAAHAIALAHLVMRLKLPVRLRLIVPAVENSVSGNAFRPGDVIKSRKGLTVENTNTDAEGRLILADALTYASEGKPDMIIDFATLTGSARAALGPEVPPFFTNNDKLADALSKSATETEDPLWRMPLWQNYKRFLKSKIADLHNSASPPGDLIYSALFLQHFVDPKIDWIHLDVFAWENSGRVGRQAGATEHGLRATADMLEKKYK